MAACARAHDLRLALSVHNLRVVDKQRVHADITIGPLVVDALRPLTDAVLDTHLCAHTNPALVLFIALLYYITQY